MLFKPVKKKITTEIKKKSNCLTEGYMKLAKPFSQLSRECIAVCAVDIPTRKANGPDGQDGGEEGKKNFKLAFLHLAVYTLTYICFFSPIHQILMVSFKY